MTIGEELRNARRARGVTVEQIAHVTKISPGVLRALEADDLGKLPGWVFTRGFLKSYAREVGLDPDRTVDTFLAQITPPQESDDAPARASRDLGEPHDVVELEERSTDLGQMIAVAIIVVAAVVYLGLHNPSPPAHASATASPSSTSSTGPAIVVPAEQPVATAGFSTPPTPVASESSELNVDLTATGPCWIQATADGEPRLQRLMNAGDHETVSARVAVSLRVGDPAALTFSLNGAAGRSLGEAGRAVTVNITPQNYRDYLAR
jgi:cytoskeleton protein RodZ